MKILVISKNEINELLPMGELIIELKKAYIMYASDKSIRPKRAVATIDDSSIVVNFPGCLPDSDCYTVKVNIKTPANKLIDLPFLIGMVLLVDRKTGQPLALLDSSLITAMRTGAAGAIGIEALACANSNRVALVGAGVQGEWQLRALHAIGRLGHVNIYDIDLHAAERLATAVKQEFKVTVDICQSLSEACSGADILITTTPNREPNITSDVVHPGLHINAFGADQPGKVELSDEVIRSSLVIVDDNDLALTDGALNVFHNKQRTTTEYAYPEIGDVLSRSHPGRTKNDQVTVFGNVGLAFQDVVACNLIYKKALSLNKGTWIDFDDSSSRKQNTVNSTLQERINFLERELFLEKAKRRALESENNKLPNTINKQNVDAFHTLRAKL